MKKYLIAITSIGAFTILAGCTTSSSPIADQQVPTASVETETWTASGRVLLPDGQPADDFAVARFWSANGTLWDESGNTPQNMTESELADFWINEGTMEPYPQKRGGGRVFNNGEFEIENSSASPCIALVLNTDRTLGGIASITSAESDPVTIMLKPLVRVFGEIRCAGEIPEWTNVYAFYPDNTNEAPD